jgi:hypothetical protein
MIVYQHIVPKLIDVLKNEMKVLICDPFPLHITIAEEMQIKPYKEDLRPLTWVMNWNDMIPENVFISILER